LFEGAIYHVAFRGVGGQDLFLEDRDRDQFVRRLSESVELFGVRLYLYCLMTNRAHLVVETPKGNLSQFMSSVLTGYCVYFNLRHRRHGHVTEGRYKAQVVEGDAYLLRLSRYIHLNPVRTKRTVGLSVAERRRILRLSNF
jgi:REP element-mobilizing transposase RayT